jgi:hypothetical protein
MAVAALKAVYQWVIRTMMKSKGETGIVKTLPNKDLVELNTQITAQRLMQNGIDPTQLKNADQVENAIIAMENKQKANLAENIRGGIRDTETAKVFDMEGKEIPRGSDIMGGKAVPGTSSRDRVRKEMKEKYGFTDEKLDEIENTQFDEKMIDDLPPPGSRGGPDDIAAPVMDVEDMGEGFIDFVRKTDPKGAAKLQKAEDEIRAKIEAANKRAIENLKKKKKKKDDDPEDMAQGGRAGFFLGSAYPKGLGLLREILKYMSKTGQELDKFQGVDLSALDMLRFANPKRFNKLLEDVRGKVNVKEGIMGTDSVRAMQQADREKRKDITAGVLQVAKDMKERDIKIKRRIAEEAENTIIPRVKKQLMEGMGMSEEAAEKTARGMAEAAQNMRVTDDPPIITKEGILELENVLKNLEIGGKKKRDLNADGGRIGFKDGMTRRTFLKLLGGLASIPIIGKIVKPIKLVTGVKKVPIIKTDDVPGKPEWFDQLVNKVIIEGDDVTKKFATGERQSIHQKTLDDGSVVRVTEDVDDGAIRVEYESEQNVFGDPVQLQYKKPLPDEGDPRPSASFDVAESGPVGRSRGPDDYEIEVDEVGGSNIRELDSDVSKLKEYATGKKLTMKEIVEAKRRRDKALAITEDIDGAQSDAVVARQGDYDPNPEEFASGGIARMLGE